MGTRKHLTYLWVKCYYWEFKDWISLVEEFGFNSVAVLKALSSPGKIPWRREWQLTPVFLPGESPWTEEPGGLPHAITRVGHNLVTKPPPLPLNRLQRPSWSGPRVSSPASLPTSSHPELTLQSYEPVGSQQTQARAPCLPWLCRLTASARKAHCCWELTLPHP